MRTPSSEIRFLGGRLLDPLCVSAVGGRGSEDSKLLIQRRLGLNSETLATPCIFSQAA